jgi:hypothetical protein
MILVTPIYYASCPLQKVYVTTKDFGCYAFVVFDSFTSYIHIQVAHAFGHFQGVAHRTYIVTIEK